MLVLRYLKTNLMCRLKTKLVLLVLRYLKAYEACRTPVYSKAGNLSQSACRSDAGRCPFTGDAKFFVRLNLPSLTLYRRDPRFPRPRLFGVRKL